MSWRGFRFGAVALVGLVASTACALCAAPQQSLGARRLLGIWWSATVAFAPWRREPHQFQSGGLLVALVVLALSAAWIAGGWLIVRDGWSPRVAACVAASWCLPFALTPPALSQDAFAYLAQGAVAGTHGGSPYRPPDGVLGPASPLLHAMDPLYRGRVAPYGPMALRLFAACLSLGRGHAVTAVICLRLLAVVCAAVTTVCAYRLAPPERRSTVVWLVAGSPLVSMHLVGGLHLEAVLAALIAGALYLHARGATRWAAVLVVASAEIKVTALVALVGLVLSSWTRTGWRAALRDLGAAAATGVALTLLLEPAPFGWLPALSSVLAVWNPLALPTLAALLWAELTGASPLADLALFRTVFLALGLVLVCYVCLSHRRRPAAVTVGFLLAAVTLTGPVLWPWYLVPCAMCLSLGSRQSAMLAAIALSVGGALSGLPMPMVQMQRVSVLAATAVLAVSAALLFRARRDGPAGASLTVP